MKRFLGVFLLVCVLLITGCSGAKKRGVALNKWLEETGKPKVLCTTEMVAEVVRGVAGDRIDCLTLITGEIDPHSYELVKGDAEKFERADVIFSSGLGLEHGASIRSVLKEHGNTLALGDTLYTSHPEQLLYFDAALDPHVWMDISLWAETIAPVAEKLKEILPEYTSEIEERASVLRHSFLEEDAVIRLTLQSIPNESRYIVTTHDAFNYFTRRYLSAHDEVESGKWKERCRAPEGLAPESQMSAFDISALAEYLSVHKIRVVFPESNLSIDSLRKVVSVCKENGAEVLICTKPLYGDSMGSEREGADSYLGMMRSNTRVMYEYLAAASESKGKK